MCPGLLVKRFGCQVDAVGPDESSRLGVYGGLSQVGRVVQRFKDTCPVLSGEVDVTGHAVAEQDPEYVITDHGHTRDYRQVVLAHAAIPDRSLLASAARCHLVPEALVTYDDRLIKAAGDAGLATVSPGTETP